MYLHPDVAVEAVPVLHTYTQLLGLTEAMPVPPTYTQKWGHREAVPVPLNYNSGGTENTGQHYAPKPRCGVLETLYQLPTPTW